MRITNNSRSRSQNFGVNQAVGKSWVVVRDGVVQPDMEHQFNRAVSQAHESAARSETCYGREVAIVELMRQPSTDWPVLAMAA
jgi:hypothetical protein